MTIVAAQANIHDGIGRSARPTIPWAEATAGKASEASTTAMPSRRR